MCRKALFEKNFLTYASWISMQIKASSFLHILNVYSHTKLNTPVLVWSLQLSNFGLNHVTEHFSVTIDCVRFLIRRFPLDTYSMLQTEIKRKWNTKEITSKGFECNKSSKAIGCQWVWVFIWFFLNSSKTGKTNKLKFLGIISLCVQMVLG